MIIVHGRLPCRYFTARMQCHVQIIQYIFSFSCFLAKEEKNVEKSKFRNLTMLL